MSFRAFLNLVGMSRVRQGPSRNNHRPGYSSSAPPREAVFARMNIGRARPHRSTHTPMTKLTLVVPLPPMFSVWNVFAPSTW